MATTVASTSSSTSSSSSKSSLPGQTIVNFLKLSETNNLLWTAQLRPFLIGHGLYQYVDDTLPTPPPTLPAADGASADPNPAYLHWFQQDQLVVSYLVATMTEPMLSLIVGKSTALEMWLCLKDSFSQHSVANAANTRFQLMDMTKCTKSISAYLQHAKSLSDSLAAICEPISSTDLVTTVLRGLGSDYAMIVTAILNFPPLPRTTAFAATQSPSPSANITHGSSYGRGQSRGNGRNGRRGNSRGRGRAPWHSTPDYSGYGSGRGYYWPQQTGDRGLLGAHPSQASQWCSTCSTSQHSYSHCPHRYNAPECLIAPFAGMHVAQYPPPPDFTWYPNTGATHHMTSSAPPDSVPYTGNTSVLLGNRAPLPITNTGNIPVSLGSHKLSLNNVFHVPSLNKNLLSVARFTKDNSVSFTFTPSGYVISDLNSGVQPFQGPCKDGLYPFSKPQPCTLATTVTNLWHRRLGHPSSTILRRLGSSSLGSDFSSSISFCNDCANCNIQVLHDFSQLATLELHQLNTQPAVVDIPPPGSVGLTEQHSPPCLAPAPAILDLVAAPAPHGTAPIVLDPTAAPLPQPLLTVPPAPPLPNHHMTTRLRDGIRQPKIRTDGTIRYPLSQAHASVLSQPFEPTCSTQAVKHSEWRGAMAEEFNALVKNDTWTLVSQSPSHNTLLKKKLDGLGNEEKDSDRIKSLTPDLSPCWKSCLAAKGQTMKPRSLKSNFKLSWYLEEEISKAIKIGVALGFDFNGKEVGLADIFAETKRKLILDSLKEVIVQ
ncbi:hypothetical protein LWI29_035292 [Acer saccharum]|uniref:GAG-pre-integrase domain-containing protein n=1 Tax=Acer saccharum TaxID=4024 RepID=A0AA39RTB5_ACESA|nr:hypothetical protein LWI29_035292 [Acer saccharum]